MISTTAAYKAAIVADSRRTLVKALVKLIDPDIVYGTTTTSGETSISQKAQIHDYTTELGAAYATLELNYWILDGSVQNIAPLNPSVETGYVSGTAFDSDGDGSEWVQLNFAGVDVLQACQVFFPDSELDGFGVNFTVTITGDTTHTETVTANTEAALDFSGFTVNNPTSIRVTVTKWSLPYRFMRVPEITPGIIYLWDASTVQTLAATRQTDFTALSIPYGTAQITFDNSDDTFSPRNKAGLFASLEDRQPIELYLAPDGAEQIPLGVYYQFNGGWKSSGNTLTMTWSLVDIIGLVQGRTYVVPSPLPVTFSAWASSIVSQLGPAFGNNYAVPSGRENESLTVGVAADVYGRSCGQILEWIAQATHTWLHADPETGYLSFEELPIDGGDLDLDNLVSYPVDQANEDVARIDITAGGTTYSYNGNSTKSDRTVAIDNPFITTSGAASSLANYILDFFGGNLIETTGRGDPSQEPGDVVTVTLKGGSTTTGRVKNQSFKFENGILAGCTTKMIEEAS